MSDWIPAAGRLPLFDKVVMVCYPSGYDGSPVYAWGARIDDSEGWLWGVHHGYNGIRPDKDAVWNSIEADDDYPVQFWKDLDPAPTLLLHNRGGADA